MTGDLPPFTTPPPGPWTPPTRVAPRHPVLAQLGGVLLFAVATVLAGIAALFLTVILAADCSEPIDPDHTLLLKVGLGALGVLWSAVPALIAHLSRRVHVGLMVPWAAVAVLAGLVTLGTVVDAQAGPVWCF